MQQDTSLHSGHVLTGLEVTKNGWRKSDKEIAIAGADAEGIDRKRAKASVILLDDALVRRLNKPEVYARNYMKEVTEPWSSSRNNKNGSRVKGNEYLLMYEDLVEYEERMQKFGDQFWSVLQKDLFAHWSSLRAAALIDLNGKYDQYFPPLADLRARYSWKVWIKPLPEPTNTKDIRLVASEQDIARAVEEDRSQHQAKMANVIGGIADDIIESTVDIAGRLGGFQHNKDGRKGNKLPKGPGWENYKGLADRIDKWNTTFPDTALESASQKIRELVDEVEKIGGGSLSDARKALGGEDSSSRDPLVEKLKEIKKTVEPATSRFEEWMNK